MTTPDKGIDESFTYADPQAARADGVDVAGMYLSHTPSKNVTPAKLIGYHKVGIGFLGLWESSAGRALEGAAAGAADGADAAAQYDALIKAVGYAPRNKPAIAFAVDKDTTPDWYPAIDAYLTAAKHALAGRYLCGVYGEADLIDHTASHGISEMEFGTYAWSGGRISIYDDFHQYLNGQRLYGAEVDLDKILHPAQVGAWWPPGSPYNVPDFGAIDPLEEIMQFYKDKADFEAAMEKVAEQAVAKFLHEGTSDSQRSVDTLIARRLAPVVADVSAIKRKVGA